MHGHGFYVNPPFLRSLFSDGKFLLLLGLCSIRSYSVVFDREVFRENS